MRTKQVFTKHEIFHKFVEQSQPYGKTPTGNVYFEDNKIYSYGTHYLLGQINGNEIVINNDYYTRSTADHVFLLINASRQFKQYFTLDIDIKKVERRIKDLEAKYINAKKKFFYGGNIISIFEYFKQYLKDKKQKEILKSDKFKQLEKTYKKYKKEKSNFLIQAETWEIKTEERKEKAAQTEKEKEQINIQKFFNYQTDYIRLISQHFIRISKDKTRVETSQGVKIPIESAKKLYYMIKNNIDIVGYKIEQYTVISINNTLTIGCHTINMENIHEIGKQIETM